MNDGILSFSKILQDKIALKNYKLFLFTFFLAKTSEILCETPD
ncbi:MAG: hypothetical protein ABH873_06530 [Candidatus Firestonebacteria bacterium]